MIEQLAKIMDKFDLDDFQETKEPTFFQKIFKKASNAIELMFQKYETLGGEVEKIQIELEKYEEEYPEEIINIMKNYIIEYNNKIDKIDFETPIRLLIYCLYNGYSVAIEQKNEWGEGYKESIVSGEEQMENFFQKYQDKLENYINEKEKQKEVEL